MAGRGNQHERVPDRVVKAQAFPHVENHTHRVKKATCRQKGEGNCLLWTNMPEAEARKLMRRP